MFRFAVKSGLAAMLCVSLTAPQAQAQEVVQQLPDEASLELTQALQRLGRNPSSVPALLDAARASLALNDEDAALGFFSRAQAVAPEDGSVMAGLALVALRRGDAVTALQLFADADAAGHRLGPYAAERGLALDLVGRNSDAQRLYRQSLDENPNDVVTRRLALSYAIAGDAARSESTLLPLLQRQDTAAYRTRAFALAILGRGDEAVSIAETMLPGRLSGRLEPYLRHMPRLTRAQQAAAANLGRFPATAEMGRDDQRVARAARNPEKRSPPAQAGIDARLIPEGPPMGQNVASAELPPAPAPVPAPVPEEEEKLTLAEAFSGFTLEASAGNPAAPRQGAVDITRIQPAREAPRPAPPPPPAHPSRHWVQVATGQDTSAFRFDWRRLVRRSEGLLEGREAFRARWNNTNRLVTGPFDSAREAQQFVTQLSGAGISAFRWTSDAGEEVAKLQ